MKTCSNSRSPILTFWAAARIISNFLSIETRDLVLTQHNAVHAYPLCTFVVPSVDRSALDKDIAGLEREALLVVQDHREGAMGDDPVVKRKGAGEGLQQLPGNDRR